VLALVAGQLDCQPRSYNQQQTRNWFSQQLLMTAAPFNCNNTLRDALQCISVHSAAYHSLA